MASGVPLQDGVLDKYKETNTWKYIIFGLVDNYSAIGVLKHSLDDKYHEFLRELPENGCRWAVYDYVYDSGEGMRSKRLFISWSPDIAKTKEKMLYASSKAALRQALPGFLTDIQATEYEEVSLESVNVKVKAKAT